MTTRSDKIIIRDLTLTMSVGIHAFEKVNLQRVIVSLEITVAPNPQWNDDDINTVLSYADIVGEIEGIAQSTHMNLVETFAERIAQSVLAHNEAIDVRVRVEKPDIIDNVAGIGVEIVRTR